MDRWQWVDAFKKIDISTAILMNMDEENFKKCCEFLIDSGMAPLSYLPKPKKTKEEEELQKIIDDFQKLKEKRDSWTSYHLNNNEVNKITSNENLNIESNIINSKSSIKSNQDYEYQEILKEELKKNELENEKLINQLKENFINIKNEDNNKNLMNEKIEKIQLFKEPNEGIQVAINLPNRKRITRKFNSFDLGENVFEFIEGQKELYNDKFIIPNYKLIYDINKELKKNLTLDEQGINKRILINLVFE